jgi:hypothetical protein
MLRLVNRLFLDLCAHRFSITLDLENVRRYPDLKKLAESALAFKGTAALASSPERTDMTDRGQPSPLDLIQSLKISRDRHLCRSLTPDIVSILNQCGNLRHIIIKDDPNSVIGIPEPSYPARLLWSSMVPVIQGGEGGHGGSGGGSHKQDGKQHWTFWDLIPLEGFLFDRLESLTIYAGCHTRLKLDHFMPRLGSSRAAKSLRALSMTASRGTAKVSWDVFRDCICSLLVLKTLRIQLIEMIYTEDVVIDSNNGSQSKVMTQLQQVAPTVKLLECYLTNHQDQDARLAVMNLFPNVESLELLAFDALFNKPLDERIFSEVGRQLPPQNSSLGQRYSTGFVEGNDSPPYQIPFPLLKSLNCKDFSCRTWEDSRIVRHWIQRAPNFRLAFLRISDAEFNSGVHEELSAHSVSLESISIRVTRQEYAKDLLSSRLCRNLEVLKFENENLDCASVVFCLKDPLESACAGILDQARSRASLFWSPTSDALLLRQQRVFARLPWTRTLTTISLPTLPCSSLGSKDESDRSVAYLRSFLQLLPHLVDFEVIRPIMDLSIFDGLGRQAPASKTHNDPSNSAQAEEFRSYLSERPWLTRIKVCRSANSKDKIADRSVSDRPVSWLARLKVSPFKDSNDSNDYKDSMDYKDSKDRITDRSAPDRLTLWRRQLLFQFRFLENLDLDAEKVYIGNGV